MRAVICKGDRTSHGGRVLEGNPNVTTGGRPIAQLGHATVCPLCKGKYPIVEGVATHTYGGKPTAVEGMHTACGATLIASQREMVIDAGGGEIRATTAHASPSASPLGGKSSSFQASLSQFGRNFDDTGKFVNGYGLK
ncbi:MAG TPA: PAAR domain-containing protein, partial [Pseudoduganella sp.]